MKSSPYKFEGKTFRYDFDRCVVEYIFKATEEDIADEQEWIEKYERPLLGIDEEGYIVASTVGLRKENWTRKPVRDEYLSGWVDELGEEERCMEADFVKYEFPHYQKKEV